MTLPRAAKQGLWLVAGVASLAVVLMWFVVPYRIMSTPASRESFIEWLSVMTANNVLGAISTLLLGWFIILVGVSTWGSACLLLQREMVEPAFKRSLVGLGGVAKIAIVSACLTAAAALAWFAFGTFWEVITASARALFEGSSFDR